MSPDFLLLDDYTVPGFGLTVSLTLPIKDEDASGDSSSTAKAKKGDKAKKLEVRINIRFKDEAKLAALVAKAEAMSSGDGQLFTVTNRVANAAGMRQGRFSGDLKVDPQQGLDMWTVSFSIAEHKSVPERAEEREGTRETATQQHSGADVDKTTAPSSSTAATTGIGQETNLDGFQRGLTTVENWFK